MIDAVEINDRISKCEKILEANPHSQIFAALADAYRKRGDLARAYDVCAEGLRAHPEYSSAHVVMAKIYLAKNNLDLASDELGKAIESTGRTRAIDLLEAEIMIRRGQKAEACLILQGLDATGPDDENVKSLMALLEEKPNPDKIELPEEISIKLDKPEKKNVTLANALNLLKVMPRVMGVLAVGHNGLLLDARFDSRNIKEEFAALSKGMIDCATSGSERIDLGHVNEILLETASSKIWIFSREKYLLVIYARDDVSMGALKLKIDDLFQSIDI
jgi:predicted regulator of Ras-like GTPase activity (Roadblock/LC7/MglB family)